QASCSDCQSQSRKLRHFFSTDCHSTRSAGGSPAWVQLSADRLARPAQTEPPCPRARPHYGTRESGGGLICTAFSTEPRRGCYVVSNHPLLRCDLRGGIAGLKRGS